MFNLSMKKEGKEEINLQKLFFYNHYEVGMSIHSHLYRLI